MTPLFQPSFPEIRMSYPPKRSKLVTLNSSSSSDATIIRRTVFFLLLIAFSALASAQSTHYYRNLAGIISPILEYKGRIPLTESVLTDAAYYAFEVDSEGRVANIRYFVAGLLNNDSYFGAAIVRYQYLPDKIIRTYFDQEEQPTIMWRHYYGGGDIHKEVFLLNDQGKKVALQLFDEEDNRVTDLLGHHSFNWDYPEEGIVVQTQKNQAGDLLYITDFFDFTRVGITTDYRGYLKRITNLDASGNLLNADSTGAAYVDFTYDSYGNEVAYPHYNQDHERINRGPYGYLHGMCEFTYEPQGDLAMGLDTAIVQVYKDAEGQAITDPGGLYKAIYHYNELRRFAGVSYFDTSNQPMSIGGFHRSRYAYNAKGDLTEIRYFDASGNPAIQSDGSVGLTINYNQQRKATASVPIQP